MTRIPTSNEHDSKNNETSLYLRNLVEISNVTETDSKPSSAPQSRSISDEISISNPSIYPSDFDLLAIRLPDCTIPIESDWMKHHVSLRGEEKPCSNDDKIAKKLAYSTKKNADEKSRFYDSSPELRSKVKVTFVGESGSGKTMVSDVLRLSFGSRKSESGTEMFSFGEDNRFYNVFDISLDKKLNMVSRSLIQRDSLVIIVWDMGAKNDKTFYVENEEDLDEEIKRKKRKALRAFDRDVDEKVQFFVDWIFKLAPDAQILIVASHDDCFEEDEALRRCNAMKKRLKRNNMRRSKTNSMSYEPNIHPTVFRVSSQKYSEFRSLNEAIESITDCIRNRNVSFFDRPESKNCDLLTRAAKIERKLKDQLIGGEEYVVSAQSFIEDNKLGEHLEKSHCNESLGNNTDLQRVVGGRAALCFLSQVGELSYYGDLPRSFRNDIEEMNESINEEKTKDEPLFLNHTILITMFQSILQHNNFIGLQQEIEEAKIDLGVDESIDSVSRVTSHCGSCKVPLLSLDEAILIWRTMSSFASCDDIAFQKIASSFEQMLVKSGAFIPVTPCGQGGTFYFLPSFLERLEVTNTWTYKCVESWKTSLCYSWLFEDEVSPSLMEQVIVGVINETVGHVNFPPNSESHVNSVCVREMLCGKDSIYLKLGSKVNFRRESIVEIFVHLAERESPLCVASATMLIGKRRLIASAKGPAGADGRMIWEGGYKIIVDKIDEVLLSNKASKSEKEVVCPDCLASKKPIHDASVWKWKSIHDASARDQDEIRCRNAHPVRLPLISGQFKEVDDSFDFAPTDFSSSCPVSKLFGGVVLIGLLDKSSGRVIRAGSGFVVDSKRGFIITASHTLIDMDNYTSDGKPNSGFGKWYYGIEDAEVVVGVISEKEGSSSNEAVYRYFAKILMADVRNVDACVLWITKKIVNDVNIDVGLAKYDVEDLRYKQQNDLEDEGLKRLSIASTCEYEERVRIIGFNQGGEGLLSLGSHVNKTADFSVGYVCKKFHCTVQQGNREVFFRPREEIVVIRCPTIGGHSGGPCVNQDGKVIGILSRSDPVDTQRCYIVPSSEWSELISLAKGRVKFIRSLQ